MRRSGTCALLACLLAGITACKGSDSPGPTGPSEPLTTISLSPNALSFTALLETGQLTAAVLDQNGATLSDATVTWSSAPVVCRALIDGVCVASGPGPIRWPPDPVATVSETGLVTAVSPGSATITAASGSARATARVTVVQQHAGPHPTVGVLEDGVPLTGLRSEGEDTYYVVNVPTNATRLEVVLTLGHEYPGLYVRKGELPTTSAYDCRGGFSVSGLTCERWSPGSGAWYVLVPGPYYDVTLTAKTTVGLIGLTTSYMVGGYPGTSYSDAIAPATGGDGNYAYSVTGGSLPAGLSLNSTTGEITGTTTGSGMSFFEITATSEGLSASAVYSITVSTNPPQGFNMWGVGVVTDMPGLDFQRQVDAVLARWEDIVTSDVGSSVLDTDVSAACGLRDSLIDGAFVDDVLMLIAIAPIDGPFPKLGGARTCLFAESAPHTMVGTLVLDNYEVGAGTVAGEDLFSLIWHEFGHAMGVGRTHWNLFSYLADELGANPRYLGPGAILEYGTLLGSSPPYVEVEDQGRLGTRDTHWRESIFRSEAMTGSLEFGEPNPISRMTIMALEDVGWDVDPTRADPYSLPPCAGSCVPAPTGLSAEDWESIPDVPTGTQARSR